MVFCHALNCRSDSKNKIRLFRFPRDKNRQFLWLRNCGKDNLKESSKLCEFHFDETQYEQNRADGWRKLKPNAVPTVFLHHSQDASSEVGPVPGDSLLSSEVSSVPGDDLLYSGVAPAPGDSFPSSGVSPVPADGLSSTKACSSLENQLPIDNVNHSVEFDSLSSNLYTPSNVEDEIQRLRNIVQSQRIHIESLHQKNKNLQMNVTYGKQQCNQLRKKLKRSNTKYKTLMNKVTKIPIIKYFAKELSNKRGKWCPDSLKIATQIRYAVGWKAYLYLRKNLGIPLPSYSTICRNTNQLDFQPGILHDMVSLMESKRKNLRSSSEADCVALIDEMDIQPSLEYDISTGSFIGFETCKEKQVMSTCVVVVMLRGLTSNWKQIIGWHLTTKSADDDVMTNMIMEVINKIEAVGYRIHGLVSDMGPKNQAIWRRLGIRVNRDNNTPYITHPVRCSYNFYIFPDGPHLLKNLRMAFINNEYFTLARCIVEANHLPCNEIRFSYLKQLYDVQSRSKDLKLAPHITSDIINPTGFNKMNVAAAAQIFSLKTAAALETLITLGIMEKEASTTVWFLREVNTWFNTMNGRHPSEAIGKANFSKSMKNLDNFLSIIENLIIGRGWKPVQTGIKTSCINSMNLIHTLFKEGYEFFLTTRINQDALENLFSMLRRYSSHPTAIQTKRCLRLISVSQFTDTTALKKNYTDDDDDHYIDFFGSLKAAKKSIEPIVTMPVEKCMTSLGYGDEPVYDDLEPISNIIQCNIINNVLGSAISYVFRKKYVCGTCAAASTVNNNDRCSIFTKALSIGFLENPSNTFLKYITLVEAHLQEHLNRCVKHPQLHHHLMEMIRVWVPFEKYGITRCSAIETGGSCFFVENVINRYIYIRQIIFVKEKSKRQKESRSKSFGSKSAQRQSII